MSNVNSEFLVNKPQFNTSSLQVGNAYLIVRHLPTSYNSPISSEHCIVTDVKPLEITITFYSEGRHSTDGMKDLTISIEDVSSGVYTLERLVPQSCIIRE